MSKQYDEVLKHLNRPVTGLSEFHERFLRLRFGLEDGRQRTYEQLVEDMGLLSRESARRIESTLLKTIKRYGKIFDAFDAKEDK